MHFDANGVQIHYQFDGPEDAPLVTMSHSLAAHSGMWWPQMDALTERFRVLRFDTRGHGQSSVPPGPYTLDQLSDDLLALWDGLGVERSHYVGLSMGGMIGQGAVLKQPERFASLTLCDTAAALPSGFEPVWEERIATAEQQGMAALVEPTIARWFTASCLANGGAEAEPVRQMIAATSVPGYVGCCRAIMGLDFLAHLPQIRVQTLVVVGEEDMGTPVALSEAIAERIDGARLVVLPGAAHFSNVEQADAFNGTVLDFLSAH